MTSKFDMRQEPRYRELFEGNFPDLSPEPLIGAIDLAEVIKVFEGMGADLNKIDFPINSGGELLDKLRPVSGNYVIVGVNVDPFRMIKYMRAYYFPIVDQTNLIEKLGEMIRENRPQVNGQQELRALKEQLKDLAFPILSEVEMIEAVDRFGPIKFRGGYVNLTEAVTRLPKDFFPVVSEQDFDRKVIQAINNRPLIQKDDPSRQVLV